MPYKSFINKVFNLVGQPSYALVETLHCYELEWIIRMSVFKGFILYFRIHTQRAVVQ